MADVLHELLSQDSRPGADPVALDYLTTLASLPLSHLEATEPQSLSQASHSLLLGLQGLSSRVHCQIIDSNAQHANLAVALPTMAMSTDELASAIPKLDAEAVHFSRTYHKSAENDMLHARKRALLLSRSVERIVDFLDLPTLLSTAITTGATTTGATTYASALDISGHVKRLHTLYPQSALVSSVSSQADAEMQAMAKNLVASLRAPGLRLASALRAISWLRRVAPDLDPAGAAGNGGGFGALFLVCRLSTLVNMLTALEPLRDLAAQDMARGVSRSDGVHTEKYLKRYLEIFREQSFAIVSMFRSIFPAQPARETGKDASRESDLQSLPSALTTFPLYLIDMLVETLRTYLPNVRDQSSRDSLLTQVLYCAGSLGRLGGDFSALLESVDVGPEAENEWVEVVKRHRLMTGRLESIVGTRNKEYPEVSVKS